MDRDRLGDKTVLITEVPHESFNTDTDESLFYPKSCRALFLEDLRTLVLVMPGPPHEQASWQFGIRLGIKLNDMGCFKEATVPGSAKCTLANANKEPDGSWGPRKKGYITFVVESSVSETARKLEHDAGLWLESTEVSHVTQVLTIKIYRTHPEIIFCMWKAVEEDESTRLQAAIVQEIRVTLANGRPMADGELCLSFADLFERRARQGTAEKDIIFSKRDLGAIARIVWEDLEFVPRG
jgi:hypothetical protein